MSCAQILKNTDETRCSERRSPVLGEEGSSGHDADADGRGPETRGCGRCLLVNCGCNCHAGEQEEAYRIQGFVFQFLLGQVLGVMELFTSIDID